MELITTGETIDAKEALAWGLVKNVYSPDTLIEEAIILATKMARMPMVALSFAKQTINNSYETSLNAGLNYERGMFNALLSTYDAKEGLSAFMEKRKPVFKNY